MKDKQATKLKGEDILVQVSTDGTTGPYINIGHGQLDEVIDLLKKNGISYLEDRKASSWFATINLGAGADAEEVQRILDATDEEIFSYEVTGAFNMLNITKFPHDNGAFKTYADAACDAITKLDADIGSYSKGVQVQDVRKDKMVALRNHLKSCTEQNCQILHDATRLRGAGKFPTPDKQ